MSSCPEIASSTKFAEALLAAPRPGADKILAFYDSRVNLVCTDPKLLLIPLDDHMCHRGDGLFESIAFRQRRLLALSAHLDRLNQGAKALDLQIPANNLKELIYAVSRASGADDGDLRVFVSRGGGGFGISPLECPTPGLYIVALRQGVVDPLVFSQGLSAFASEIPPKQDYLARIKNTNYLPNVLMAQEANAKGMDVAISFDQNGIMGEAAIANAAIIDQNGTLVAPAFDGILAGTTLISALKLAERQMPVRQGPIYQEDIKNAREMLLFTSATLCVPITSFNGIPIGNGKPGPIAKWLRKELTEEMLKTGDQF